MPSRIIVAGIFHREEVPIEEVKEHIKEKCIEARNPISL